MAVRVLESGTKLPSVEPLNRVILSWDFYRDIRDDRKAKPKEELEVIRRGIRSADRSGDAAAAAADAERFNIVELPTRFASEDDYISRFYTLFLLEAKQSIHRSKEMEMDSAEIVVQVMAEARDGFFILTLQRAENSTSGYFTSDLCLLYVDPPGGESEQPALDNQTASVAVDPLTDNPHHALCIVENSVRNLCIVKLVLPSPSPDDERTITRVTKIAQAINTNGKRWYFARVMGMSTLNREYQALMSFPDMVLKDELVLSGEDPIAECLNIIQSLKEQQARVLNMNASPVTRKAQMKRLEAMEKKRRHRLQILRQKAEAKVKEVLEIPHTLMKRLEQMYNSSQMAALRDCLKAQGVTLIQGPPGTGKTTTIVGVLSVILNAAVRRTRTQKEPLSGLSTPEQSDAEDESKAGAETRRRFVRSQPWIYDAQFQPWYDQVRVFSEDLECFVCKDASETDAILNLGQVTLESQPRRVLVCAPSNAAVDEILKRLTADPEKGGGVFDGDGERYNPTVVRVGPNVHPELVAHSLESRANLRLQAMGNAASTTRDSIKMSILSETRVVCSTLSICGSRELASFMDGFDTVVIDEASQGVEVSTLIPLRLGCRRLILVGDPKQLPATVFSRVALQHKYDQSLFQRLERAGHKVNLLSVQYRMHPSIAAFPSFAFYETQLLNAENIEKIVKPPIPWYSIPLFRPVVFFSLSSKESAESTSVVNAEEAQFAVQLVELLGMMFGALPGMEATWAERVAIISPYAEQVRLIRKSLRAKMQIGPGQACPIDVNTVDGFQGREKDLVIFSAVRSQYVASSTGVDPDQHVNVGFLSDVRRMNVALTRARYNLFVVGNAAYLRGNPEWAKFIHYTEAQDFQFTVNYAKYPRDGYLKRWLAAYFARVPASKELLSLHAPKFVEKLEQEVAVLQHLDSLQAGAPKEGLAEEVASALKELQPSTKKKWAVEADEGDYDEEALRKRDFALKPPQPTGRCAA